MYYEVFKESWIPSGLDHPEVQFGSLFRTGPGVVIGPLSRSKGHRVVMIKLLLIAALFLTSASAQNQDQKDGELSLVELARLERDRRAHLGKPDRIITNADLKEFKGKVSSSVAVLDPAEEKKDKVEKAKEQVVEAPKEVNYDLGTWQDLFTSAKLKLGLLVSEGEDLQDKMTELINGWIRVSNGQVEAPPNGRCRTPKSSSMRTGNTSAKPDSSSRTFNSRPARRACLPAPFVNFWMNPPEEDGSSAP